MARRAAAWALVVLSLVAGLPVHGQPDPGARARLAEAMLSEDADLQMRVLKELIGSGGDPMIVQALASWRGGAAYLFETNGTRIPVILEAQTDSEGRARAQRVADGTLLTGPGGEPLLFAANDLPPADANARLRRVIKTTLDLFGLAHPNPKMRRDAVIKLGQAQNAEYLPHFEEQSKTETNSEVRRALEEARSVTQLVSDDPATRDAAVRHLGDARSINSLAFLRQLQLRAESDATAFGVDSRQVVRQAIREIETYIWWGNLFGTAFRGLSLSAVLLVAALGLAITFGLMGVINMAHGEIIMVGAYTAYVTQNLFAAWFPGGGVGMETYFVAALAGSFLVAGAVGLLLERGIIRFLYRRPLESLLATWGVSLVLQQVFRHAFGAANVQVSSPSWLSGSLVIHDVLLAYNRLFVIAFAFAIVGGTYLLLTRTSLGLQIRAVMQNRAMASALGVRTDRVNMLTFAFGSGLAGMAGACLSQIGNVGPSLGQNYIVDCFMVVVLGGVGNLVGTVSASLGIGVTDQILQPWLGAVMGKIVVLGAIILFLQWRPAGLFATRTRNLEG